MRDNIQTPWMITCPNHGQVFLTSEEYMDQMYQPDTFWECPICGESSEWNDENYDQYDGPDYEDGEWADGWDIRNS
jgi:hypothetical protein